MRKSYPSDVSREQFEKIRCMVPECGGMIKYEKKIPSKEELWLYQSSLIARQIEKTMDN